MPPSELTTRLAELEHERDELEASLPAHSTPPALLIRLEDLEDAIAALRAQIELRAQLAADSGADDDR